MHFTTNFVVVKVQLVTNFLIVTCKCIVGHFEAISISTTFFKGFFSDCYHT